MPPKDDLAAYFAAACALRSEAPPARRSAIEALLELARRMSGPVRARARRTLIQEFGPYAVEEGMPLCTAPMRIVERCEDDCRSCPWLRLNQPLRSKESSAR